MRSKGNGIQTEILGVLRQHVTPLSAYDILAKLRVHQPKIAPTTIYRALSTLTDQGKVHRLESLNAFMASQCNQHKHAAILSICDGCGRVKESVAPDLLGEIAKLINQSGFKPLRHIIEVHGLCANCDQGQVPA